MTTTAGAIVAASSFAATQAVLSARDVGFSITEPGALRLVVVLRLVQVGPYEVPFPWSLGWAWFVYGAWALVAAVVTVTAVHRQDQ